MTRSIGIVGEWDHLFPEKKRSFGDFLVVNFADSSTSIHSFFSTIDLKDLTGLKG